VQVVAELAHQVLKDSGPIDWQSMVDTGRIRETIAKVVPGFEKLAEIGKTKQEFHVAGRLLHTPKFYTPDGRAVLHLHELPELRGGPGELRLMTVRSEGQFNTVVYEEEDIYRNQDRRDVILLHPTDIERLGLAENQRVTVASETGRMDGILVRPFPEIRAGNALMYYPEANVLVPRHADPLSKTPAFKSVVVTITAAVPVAAR
jgi:anaerobic selenocysteine-containing dehydrogenase